MNSLFWPVILMLVVVVVLVWNMAKPFGILSSLRLMKAHSIGSGGKGFTAKRFRVRKGHVRTWKTVIAAMRREHHACLNFSQMERLNKEIEVPPGIEIISRTEKGVVVLRRGSAAGENEMRIEDFPGRFERFTEFAGVESHAEPAGTETGDVIDISESVA